MVCTRSPPTPLTAPHVTAAHIIVDASATNIPLRPAHHGSFPGVHHSSVTGTSRTPPSQAPMCNRHNATCLPVQHCCASQPVLWIPSFARPGTHSHHTVTTT